MILSERTIRIGDCDAGSGEEPLQVSRKRKKNGICGEEWNFSDWR